MGQSSRGFSVHSAIHFNLCHVEHVLAKVVFNAHQSTARMAAYCACARGLGLACTCRALTRSKQASIKLPVSCAVLPPPSNGKDTPLDSSPLDSTSHDDTTFFVDLDPHPQHM